MFSDIEAIFGIDQVTTNEEGKLDAPLKRELEEEQESDRQQIKKRRLMEEGIGKDAVNPPIHIKVESNVQLQSRANRMTPHYQRAKQNIKVEEFSDIDCSRWAATASSSAASLMSSTSLVFDVEVDDLFGLSSTNNSTDRIQSEQPVNKSVVKASQSVIASSSSPLPLSSLSSSPQVNSHNPPPIKLEKQHQTVNDQAQSTPSTATISSLPSSSPFSSSSSCWPISMRGKTIASVSLSSAERSRLTRRADKEKEQEFIQSASTLPSDKHVHGPAISDHSRPKTHIGGYWRERMEKLTTQKANVDIYERLELFQTPQQREADRLKNLKKRIREEECEKRSATFASTSSHQTDENILFTLGQMDDSLASQLQTSAAPLSQAKTGETFSTHSTPSVQSGESPPSGGIFTGVVLYFNGDTETRFTTAEDGIDLSTGMSELSTFHLANMVKCQGGLVLPIPSRSLLTHYIVDHLSWSKARDEFHTKFVKSARSNCRPIHFVKPAWIRACMKAGRRVSEVEYSVVRDDRLNSIRTAFGRQIEKKKG